MKLEAAEWSDLWRRIGAQGDPQAHFEKIDGAYQEPHRHYHNREHIAECLREFRNVQQSASHANEIEMALWLHDVIYDPMKADNEEQSARVAVEMCHTALLPQEFARRVESLILATRHNVLASEPNAQLIVDIDLAILGKLEERFWRYEQDVRKEYLWVPEETFRTKRAEILEDFLRRKRIYTTPYFVKRYEAQARRNLSESVKRLRGEATQF